MYEHNQVEIPPAFMALYSRNGRPLESRAFIEQRYDVCEDMAQQLSVFCAQVQAKEDLSEAEVLKRCQLGLAAVEDARAPETDWVIGRVAELLEWPALPTAS